tara:strand:+ start:1124 stop:1837 length:714 start_codon:yes stop_codon:yes gene_type:complete
MATNVLSNEDILTKLIDKSKERSKIYEIIQKFRNMNKLIDENEIDIQPESLTKARSNNEDIIRTLGRKVEAIDRELCSLKALLFDNLDLKKEPVGLDPTLITNIAEIKCKIVKKRESLHNSQKIRDIAMKLSTSDPVECIFTGSCTFGRPCCDFGTGTKAAAREMNMCAKNFIKTINTLTGELNKAKADYIDKLRQVKKRIAEDELRQQVKKRRLAEENEVEEAAAALTAVAKAVAT